MTLLLSILIDGLVYASGLFITAAGLTLIYGVMRILNMAHGSFYAIGAYSAASAVGIYFAGGYPPWGSFLILFFGSAAMGALAGLAAERGVLSRLYGRDEVVMVLVTYGLLLVFEDLIKLTWGVEGYYAYQPYGLLGRVKIADIRFVNYDLALIGVAALIAFLMWYALNRTVRGKLLRAVIQDQEISIAMGIDVKKVFIVTFMIGAGLGALAGGLAAPAISVVPGLGIEVIVLAFAVVVTGGLGSIEGALVGAVLIGIVRAASVNLFPEGELFVIYGVMACVLAFRPHGLFALPSARKI